MLKLIRQENGAKEQAGHGLCFIPHTGLAGDYQMYSHNKLVIHLLMVSMCSV